MATGRKTEPLIATTSFVTEVKGEEVFVHAGDVVPANSALVKGREELFVPQSEYVQKAGKPAS
jgi:hypothetical protein